MSDTTQPNASNALNALDYISRREAVSAISDLLMLELKGKRLPTWNEVYRAINAVPSAQPERKKGKWKYYAVGGWHCSECHCSATFWFMETRQYRSKFCPNCGAKMDGKEKAKK